MKDKLPIVGAMLAALVALVVFAGYFGGLATMRNFGVDVPGTATLSRLIPDGRFCREDKCVDVSLWDKQVGLVEKGERGLMMALQPGIGEVDYVATAPDGNAMEVRVLGADLLGVRLRGGKSDAFLMFKRRD